MFSEEDFHKFHSKFYQVPNVLLLNETEEIIPVSVLLIVWLIIT